MSPSIHQSTHQTTEANSPSLPIELLLSVATVPVLLALVGGKALTGLLQDIGQMSEEVFRGDRLPILNLVNSNTEKSESPD